MSTLTATSPQLRVGRLITTVSTAWVTVAITLVALASVALPGVSELLQYDRLLIAEGEVWRTLTGHITHWNADHLFWDLSMFALLGYLCERRDRRKFVICLALSAIAIPVAIWTIQPEMTTYRGLSGIDTAVFVLLAIQLLIEKWRSGDWLLAGMISALMVGLIGKIVLELITGATAFVDHQAAGFTPLPLAHIVGAIVACCICWSPAFRLFHRQAKAWTPTGLPAKAATPTGT